MNWKTDLQVRDLDASQRLEAVCRKCGHTHYLSIETLLNNERIQSRYLDEIEAMTSCQERGCKGSVRLALTHTHETEGFTGGLAL